MTADENDCCVKRAQFVGLVKDITSASSYMTDFMAKVLDGNILYTPDNTKTRRVMDKVSLFFEMVGVLKGIKFRYLLFRIFLGI